MFDMTTEAGRRAERRLREEGIAWLTTVRADGQPQSVPLWYLWDDNAFLIYSQPNRQKLRNVALNPQVGMNLTPTSTGATSYALRAERR